MGSFSATLLLLRHSVLCATGLAACTHPHESRSVLLCQRGDDALAFFFDVLGKSGMALLDESSRESQFEERDRESGREVVQIRTHFCELYGFDGFVEKLLHRFLKLIVEQFLCSHGEVHCRG